MNGDAYSHCRQETRFIHSGQQPDPHSGAVTIPVTLSTTFIHQSPGVFVYKYGRIGNPNREAFENCIASAENGKYGISFSSGMAAIQSVISLLSPGDHIIITENCYGGVRDLANDYISRHGILHTFIDTCNLSLVQQSFKSNTKMIWIESPTNPTLRIADIEEISRIAHSNNCLSVIDNTFATPYCQSPFAFGVDIIVHSATKYIGGHSDLQMGVVVTSLEEVHTHLRFVQETLGSVPSPFDCYNALKGMKTLHLRMKAHSKNALKVARFLESHPKIEKVVYPGLESHPQHEIAKKQMRYFSGMVTFYMRGGLPQVKTFLDNIHVVLLAESLGAVESLVKYSVQMDYALVPAELRAELGISEGMIRFSVGIENIEDIIGDLEQALEKVIL